MRLAGCVSVSLVALGGLICVREREADMSTSSHQRQYSSVGNNIP